MYTIVPVNGNVKVTAYKYILDNYMLPTLGQQFWGRPLPVPAGLCHWAQSGVHGLNFHSTATLKCTLTIALAFSMD